HRARDQRSHQHSRRVEGIVADDFHVGECDSRKVIRNTAAGPSEVFGDDGIAEIQDSSVGPRTVSDADSTTHQRRVESEVPLGSGAPMSNRNPARIEYTARYYIKYPTDSCLHSW